MSKDEGIPAVTVSVWAVPLYDLRYNTICARCKELHKNYARCGKCRTIYCCRKEGQEKGQGCLEQDWLHGTHKVACKERQAGAAGARAAIVAMIEETSPSLECAVVTMALGHGLASDVDDEVEKVKNAAPPTVEEVPDTDDEEEEATATAEEKAQRAQVKRVAQVVVARVAGIHKDGLPTKQAKEVLDKWRLTPLQLDTRHAGPEWLMIVFGAHAFHYSLSKDIMAQTTLVFNALTDGCKLAQSRRPVGEKLPDEGDARFAGVSPINRMPTFSPTGDVFKPLLIWNKLRLSHGALLILLAPVTDRAEQGFPTPNTLGVLIVTHPSGRRSDGTEEVDAIIVPWGRSHGTATATVEVMLKKHALLREPLKDAYTNEGVVDYLEKLDRLFRCTRAISPRDRRAREALFGGTGTFLPPVDDVHNVYCAAVNLGFSYNDKILQ